GLMVDMGLYQNMRVKENLPQSKQVIQEIKEHPNLLDWKIMDEPEVYEAKLRVEVAQAYREYKALDPDHPLLLTVSRPEEQAFWFRFCDILQVDPYPLPGKPLTLVADEVASARKAAEPWQNISVVLEAGYRPTPSLTHADTQPTKAQARAMVYLALIN